MAPAKGVPVRKGGANKKEPEHDFKTSRARYMFNIEQLEKKYANVESDVVVDLRTFEMSGEDEAVRAEFAMLEEKGHAFSLALLSAPVADEADLESPQLVAKCLALNDAFSAEQEAAAKRRPTGSIADETGETGEEEEEEEEKEREREMEQRKRVATAITKDEPVQKKTREHLPIGFSGGMMKEEESEDETDETIAYTLGSPKTGDDIEEEETEEEGEEIVAPIDRERRPVSTTVAKKEADETDLELPKIAASAASAATAASPPIAVDTPRRVVQRAAAVGPPMRGVKTESRHAFDGAAKDVSPRTLFQAEARPDDEKQ